MKKSKSNESYCKYFKLGSCREGTKCKFSHEEKKESIPTLKDELVESLEDLLNFKENEFLKTALYDISIKCESRIKIEKEKSIMFNEYGSFISHLFHSTSPIKELLRKKYFKELSEDFENLIREKLKRDSPTTSFSRWIIERQNLEIMKAFKNKEKQIEALLPDKCEPVNSPLLYQELKYHIPIKLSFHQKNLQDSKKAMLQFIEDIKLLIDENFPAQREMDEKKIEEIKNYIKNVEIESKTKRDYKQLIRIRYDLREFVKTPLFEKMEPVIELVCYEMSQLAFNKREKFILESQKLQDDSKIEISLNDSVVTLSSQESRFRVTSMHFKKLAFLHKKNWERNKAEGDWKSTFYKELFCLCVRYDTYIVDFDSSGIQSALPSKTFECLTDLFGVQAECFASPFNCYYPNFCSLFADTDCKFGSSGSFFQIENLSGSFECNPPFIQEIIVDCVNHIQFLLKKAEEDGQALSFILFIPRWKNNPVFEKNISESPFLTFQFIAKLAEHEYVDGKQHVPFELNDIRLEKNKTQFLYDAVFDTSVYFLQNSFGAQKWKVVPEKINTLKESMKSKKRDLKRKK